MQAGNRTRTRVLGLEAVECRSLLAGDFLSAVRLLALDVSGDGAITPADALQLINGLNTYGSASWQAEGEAAANVDPLRRLDANGDDAFTPLDALTVINRLNEHGAVEISLADLVGEAANDLTPEQQASIELLVQGLQEFREASGIYNEQIAAFASELTDLVGEAVDPTDEQIDALKSAFFDAIADGDLSASDIDSLKADVQQWLVQIDVDPVKAEQFLDKWTAVIEQSDLTEDDLDALLLQVEGVVNAFAPGTLDLPDAATLVTVLGVWLDEAPTWLASPVLNASNPGSFQQTASAWLGAFSGQDVVNLLNSPALTVSLPVLGSLNPGTALSWWGRR